MKKTITLKQGIEIFAQIFLIVSLTFSVSYIYREAFNSEDIAIVSAQEEEITPPTDEQIQNLKNEYPSLAENSNEELKELMVNMVEEGVISEVDYDNPSRVMNVLGEKFEENFDNIEAGQVDFNLFAIIGKILDALGFIPKALNIPGGAFQNALLDVTGGLYLCEESFNGEICQVFIGNEIDDVCASDKQTKLSDGKIPKGHTCELGYCVDSNEGDALPQTPKSICLADEGMNWYEEDSLLGKSLTQSGCCIINGEYNFVNSGQCEKMTEQIGVELGADGNEFDSSIREEPQCLDRWVELDRETKMGACVLENIESGEVGCSFASGSECSSIGGEFLENILCSNQEEIEEVYGRELETICEPTASASCIDGKDEIYWLDSCGNRENIFEGDSESQKQSSWNGGLVKRPEELNCDPLEDSDCGKCDSFKSSICSIEEDSSGAICKDMRCTDANGQKREHGESWCAYQSSIGLFGLDLPGTDAVLGAIIPNNVFGLIGGQRSTDTPGSSHFRVECDRGEIKAPVACEVGRAEICVEERTEKSGGGEFSQAACVKNNWPQCFDYNPSTQEGRLIGMTGKDMASKILDAKLALTCGLDSQCFVKRVDLTSGGDDTFKFSYCAPRYPPGFELRNPDSGKDLCAQASQTCTAVFVKEISGWKCRANCDCVDGEDPGSAKASQKFLNEMNAFCTSLGDCGNSVNYVGDQPGGKGYSITQGDSIFDKFSGITDVSNYLSFSLNVLDAEPTPGEYISANQTLFGGVTTKEDIDGFLNEFGIGDILKQIDEFISGLSGSPNGVPKISSGYQGGIPDAALYAGGTGATMVALNTLSVTKGVGIPIPGGFSGALLGAAAGAALTGFLIDILGIGPGLSSAVAYTLIGAGAVGGAIIVSNYVFGAQILGAGGPIGIIILVVTIIILVILKLFGVGEVKEVPVSFECKPWVPPRLGVNEEKCGSCGEDGLSDGSEKFPCSKYSCEALGLDCVFVPEKEGYEDNAGACVYSPNQDTQAPRLISVGDEIGEGFEYRDFQEGPPEGHFEINNLNGAGGCLNSRESVTFGFKTDEWASCYLSGAPKESLAEMIPIASTSIDKKEFGLSFNSLDLERFGIEGGEFEERNDVDLYIACEDLKGNNNLGQEHSVGLCVIRDDNRPPLITVPLMDILPFGTEEHELVFYTDEPAECKWSSRDESYSEMNNDASCQNSLEERIGGKFECRAGIPIIDDETEIFIRCLDRPEWKGTDKEAERNANNQGVKVELIRSDTTLKIDYVTPDGETIMSGGIGAVITLQAETSSGVDGTAQCEYKFDGNPFLSFEETGGRVHRQDLGKGTSKVGEGEHNVIVQCTDSANNVAEKSAVFNVEIDDNIPTITRIYSSLGKLFVVANEPGECSYLNAPLEGKDSACSFSVDEGDLMSVEGGSNEQTHSTEFTYGKKYYIKCKDKQGNEPSLCNEIVEKGF